MITYHNWWIHLILLVQHRWWLRMYTWSVAGIFHALLIHITLLFRTAILRSYVESRCDCTFIRTCWKTMLSTTSFALVILKSYLMLFVRYNCAIYRPWVKDFVNIFGALNWNVLVLLRLYFWIILVGILDDWFWWSFGFKRTWTLLKSQFTFWVYLWLYLFLIRWI